MTDSNRINAIKSLVPHGTRLLDIGSDHGILPEDLLDSGQISRAFVTDINEGPLNRSRLRLGRFCTDGNSLVDFALSDGFSAVPCGSYDTAAICGMGGELIARIIDEGGVKAHCLLILQPMTMYDRLRAYLWDSGFTIEKELYPTEGKRAYLVMAVRYTGTAESYTAAETYLGKLHPADDGFAVFAASVKQAAENRLRGTLHTGDSARAETERSVIAAAESCML